MASDDFVDDMNAGLTTEAFGSSRYSPALTWQTGLIDLITPTVGNIDLDPFGYVDENDAEILRQYLDGKITLNANQRRQADVNGNGTVDQSDLDTLLQYIDGTITVFPVDK